ncbi:MAG: DUF512 domain-containing protein [Clostridia bacterium]|nr:DUF512 domain-containing protein [Clostridia bacterium]
MTKITYVEPGSIAQEAGIVAGDFLVALNGKKVNDILEYKFITADFEYEITIKKQDGSFEVIEIVNEYAEDLGLEFENALLSKAKSCANKCIFCFIDQMPKGMRETLYFKDDDSRLSFLQGNYITMTNLSDKDIKRITDIKMSPVNISVHCTDGEKRKFMLGNKKADKLLAQMKQLDDAGISMNCQIVLCPGINDGEVLDKTLSDLSRFSNVYSVSIVPVGITKYRKGLYPLTPFDKQKSVKLIEQVSVWQNKFLQEKGSVKVYLADEFYIMAETGFPPYEHYEDFPQLENGVGMARLTICDFDDAIKEIKQPVYKKVSVATGKISEKLIKDLVSKIEGIDAKVYAIENDFFGKQITVSGLVTGGDIINQLKGKDLGQCLFIPINMLRADTDVFLDDITVSDVEKALNVKIVVTEDARDFALKLKGEI